MGLFLNGSLESPPDHSSLSGITACWALSLHCPPCHKHMMVWEYPLTYTSLHLFPPFIYCHILRLLTPLSSFSDALLFIHVRSLSDLYQFGTIDKIQLEDTDSVDGNAQGPTDGFFCLGLPCSRVVINVSNVHPLYFPTALASRGLIAGTRAHLSEGAWEM